MNHLRERLVGLNVGSTLTAVVADVGAHGAMTVVSIVAAVASIVFGLVHVTCVVAQTWIHWRDSQSGRPRRFLHEDGHWDAPGENGTGVK